MDERYKYSLNGECRFENVPEQLANNEFSPIALGSAGGVRWTAKLSNFVHGNEIIIQALYSLATDFPESEYRVHGYFKVINWENSKKKQFVIRKTEHLTPNMNFHGPKMPFFDVLNLKNGWLDENGRLSIEYGIQVESMLDFNGIWKFNVYDKIIDRDSMIIIGDHIYNGYRTYYCHKQLVSFHSTRFRHQSIYGPYSYFFNLFLQIAHGVQFELDFKCSGTMLKFARKYKLWNVKHSCERKIITNFFTIHRTPRERQLKKAVKFNLTRFLIHSIRSSGSTDHILEVLKTSKTDKMSCEMMKMIIASCLYGKFLDY